MRYSVTRILKNLRRHCLIYLAVTVNFALGAGFFVICMNFERTSRELLEESRRRSVEGEICVHITRGPEYTDDSLIQGYPISYDTYRTLAEDRRYEEELELLIAMDFHKISSYMNLPPTVIHMSIL